MKRLLTHSLITVTVNVIAIIGILLIFPAGNLASPESGKQMPSTQIVKYNRLINESSPYLLQHATNPIDWYPWGSEAFEKAKREDKPIFLSKDDYGRYQRKTQRHYLNRR